MSIQQEHNWITGPEYRTEWQRLKAAGVPYDDPRYEALRARLTARDNYLYERFGKVHRPGNEGRWIAISLEGEVILGDTLGEVIHAAHERWGSGGAALRKLADFPGLEWVTP